MAYTMYTPLNVWLDPASVTDVVAYIQTYLSENTIYSETEIETIIHDYLIAHPELIGGVQSVNGKTGTVVLTASDINTSDSTTIQAVLNSLSADIAAIVQSVTNEVTARSNADTELSGRITTNATGITNEATVRANADTALGNRITALQGAVGSPLVAATASAMTDTSKIYVYTGSETGYTKGNWYYYNGSAWTSGGVYNATAINTDTTLTVAGMAADAKATGDELNDLKSSFNYVQTYTGQLTEHTFSAVGGYTTDVYLEANKTYTLKNVSPVSFTGVVGVWINGDTSVVLQLSGTKGTVAEFTPATSGYLRLYNNVASTITIAIQVFGIIDAENESFKESINTLNERYVLETSKNMFNVDDSDNHWGVSQNDCYRLSSVGAVYHETSGMDAIYSVSHMIKVDAGKTVYFSSNNNQTGVFQLACYDANKSMIGSLYNWKEDFTIPSGTEYIRFSASTLANSFQCEYDARTTYEEFYQYVFLNGVKVFDTDVFKTEDDVFVLPVKMYGVQNKEFDIFLKNVITGNYARFVIQKSGTGEQLSRRIKYLVASAGTTTTTLMIKDSDYETRCTAQVSYVNANANAHSGETLKVLTIGDSFINSGNVTQGLINDFADDVANLQLLGTLGTSPNLHEGRSGWSTYDYVNTASYNGFTNPFLNNGVFDFSHYMSASGIAMPDYVIINLGINDILRPMGGTTTAQNLQTMINSIHAYNSSIKVLIGTTPSPYLGDAENGYLANLIENKKRQNITLNVLENVTESSTVIIAPTHLNFDTDYNFRMGTVAKNGENSETVPYCEDVTHPLNSGFYQIADSYYACIKAN